MMDHRLTEEPDSKSPYQLTREQEDEGYRGKRIFTERIFGVLSAFLLLFNGFSVFDSFQQLSTVRFQRIHVPSIYESVVNVQVDLTFRC